MLPRRCKKCRCYVAPQLTRCPRCNKATPSLVVVAPTKEEKQSARAKQDAKVPLIHAKHIHWIPSAFSLEAHRNMVEELKRRLAKADTARMRNTIRSEMRCVKLTLARENVPKGKKGWTSETFHTKQQCISIFISPKKYRYVLADKDGPADLIIANRKRNAPTPFSRLCRFEKSRYARMKKAEKQEETTNGKRVKAKKDKRAKHKKAKSQS
jgi:hypothetical protein